MEEQTGLSIFTIYISGWLTNAFPPARRRAELSWAHHREVGALPAAVADQLLADAVKGRWSVTRTRAAAVACRLELDTEALRLEHAEQRRLSLSPAAMAWHSDSKRIERECRERLISAEASVRSVVDAVRALVDHPGASLAHGNRRRAATARLRAILAPIGDTGIDLTAQIAPLLDTIWSPDREDGR